MYGICTDPGSRGWGLYPGLGKHRIYRPQALDIAIQGLGPVYTVYSGYVGKGPCPGLYIAIQAWAGAKGITRSRLYRI